MNSGEQIILIDRFLGEVRETLIAKGDDYAGEDRLSVFKETSSFLGCNPSELCMMNIGVKVKRILNLWKSDKVNFESLQDSVKDLAGYVVLLYCIESEEEFLEERKIIETARSFKDGEQVKFAEAMLSFGISPERYNEVINKEIQYDISKDISGE